ncbi:LYR motif-containing protein 4 [Entomortierella parvispora]|uniref:LYR motif-containing protein 4 n=1 Tax=Entomortierella parvispora TaxID=205924 RepID=A0A9P3HAQ4_9FUNG|nr:LYR motif-containing protein 4 [Entomortierella parvispora]
MPTVAPVPASFTALSHRAQVVYLYRHILRESARFFDERTSQWARARAQETFAKNKRQRNNDRVQKNMADARKALRLLERANQMDLKAVQRLLRSSHGLQGVERRRLMQPLVDSARVRTLSPSRLATSLSGMGSHMPTIATTPTINGQESSSSSSSSPSTSSSSSLSSSSIPQSTNLTTEQLAGILAESIQQPKPLFFKKERTIPPIYSAPVAALIKSTGKSIEPTLPEPLFKPLHGKREANLRWRFFSKQISKLKPPLPAEIRQEVEWKSRIGLNRLGSRMDSNKQDGTTTLPPVNRLALTPTAASMTEDSFSTAFKEWEERILQTIRAWNKNGQEQKAKRFETGRFHPSIGGKPAKSNTLTPRLYRRLWRQLLDEVPVLDIEATGVLANGKDAGEGQKLSPSNLAFSVSKSPESHHLRATAGLREMAVVNDFDRIGMVVGADAPPTPNKKTRKNKGA